MARRQYGDPRLETDPDGSVWVVRDWTISCRDLTTGELVTFEGFSATQLSEASNEGEHR